MTDAENVEKFIHQAYVLIQRGKFTRNELESLANLLAGLAQTIRAKVKKP